VQGPIGLPAGTPAATQGFEAYACRSTTRGLGVPVAQSILPNGDADEPDGRAYQPRSSCWMDDLNRRMIVTGDLARRVAEEGLRGITSNPAIFEKAVAQGTNYDHDLARAAAAGSTAEQIYEELPHHRRAPGLRHLA